MSLNDLLVQNEIGGKGIFKITPSPVVPDEVQDMFPHLCTAVAFLYYELNTLKPQQGYVLEYGMGVPGTGHKIPVKFFFTQDKEPIPINTTLRTPDAEADKDDPNVKAYLDVVNSNADGNSAFLEKVAGKTKVTIYAHCQINEEIAYTDNAVAIIGDLSVVDDAILKELFVARHISYFISILNNRTTISVDLNQAHELGIEFRKAGIFTVKNSKTPPKIKYSNVEDLFKLGDV